MIMDLHRLCWIILIHLITVSQSQASSDYFTGAVFEHARQLDGVEVPPRTRIQANLKFYEKAVEVAKEQAADIIVFPEYGIFPPSSERNVLKPFLERIPNPKTDRVIPCDEAELFSERPILYSLSCMAKIHQIVIVANMGGIEDCDGKPGCPGDGDLHLNANVAFDKNGTLLGRYYKERLYFEMGMDLPLEEQDPTFQTNFGKFAMFICFDIIYQKMADVSQREDIDAVLFSTMWMNSSPFYTSTQWWQAWAMGNNATLLASNIQIPGYASTGSGIYRGREDPLVQTFNPDGISKLLVATISKSNTGTRTTSYVTAITMNGTEEWRDDGNSKDVPSTCSYDVLGEAENVYKDYRCLNEKVQNYTLVKLSKPEDHLEVCHNGMCCELDYVTSNMSGTFYFGVYNGTHIPYFRYPWEEENCFLARCDDFNGTSCSNFPMVSETLFHALSMTANFTTKHIYPSIVRSEMKLIPVENWIYNARDRTATIGFMSDIGIPLIATTLKGRPYDKDPPYVR